MRISDWSSDVCSSDLKHKNLTPLFAANPCSCPKGSPHADARRQHDRPAQILSRQSSPPDRAGREPRRVGKSAEMRALVEEVAAQSDLVTARFDGDDARRPSYAIRGEDRKSTLLNSSNY